MKIRHIKQQIIKLSLLSLLTGCASAPVVDDDEYTGAQLSNNSTDVLFESEYSVESETDALKRADHALQGGNVDEALFFYIKALKHNPENVELLANIGEIQYQLNNYAKAKQAFLLAKGFDPTHSRSLEGLGLLYMDDGLNDQAIKELQTALANDHELWRAHNALGVYADKSSNFAAARDHYDAALSINPNAAYVLNNRGYSRFLAGDFPGATADLYEAANNRDFPSAWANLGMVYANHGWYDDAISTYRNVMSEAHAYNNTGKIALKNGDFPQAMQYLHEAIRLSPTYFPEAQQNLTRLEYLDR
jgi:tetratricopeptide (TPR) repeat protein